MDALGRPAKMMDKLGGRLPKALALSLALHLALMMLIQPAPQGGSSEVVLQARIVAAPERVTPRPLELADNVTVLPTVGREEARIQTELPAETSSDQVEARSESSGQATVSDTPDLTKQEAEVRAGEQESVGSQQPSGLPEIPVMLDTRWYTAREVDIHPRPVKPIQPQYPEPARIEGIQGNVVIQIRIDQYGVVQDIEVVESTPPGVFDQSSLEAFRHARFHPAQREGRPVRALVKIRVTFELD